MARSPPLRWHPGLTHPYFYGRTGPMERTGHLSLCRRVRRDGTSFAWHDPRLWRSGPVSSVQDSVCGRPDCLVRRLHLVFRLQHSGGPARRARVGDLARHDADLWLLPDL